jgi:hypothetical protein
MFMATRELKNTVKLTKIRLSNSRKQFMWTFIALIILIGGNLIPSIIGVFAQSDSVAKYSLQDYSIPFIFGFLVFLIIDNVMYRANNRFYSVYPQTNTSRYLSTQGLHYLYLFGICAALALMYLIQYSVFAVIAIFHSNVKLVYNFNAGFVVSGLFVLIMYISIVNEVVNLISVLIRKFRIYAILSFVFLFAAVVGNLVTSIELFKAAFGFLLFEGNLALFFLKGAALWAVLFYASFFINRHTSYYKSGFTLSKPAIAVIGAIGVVAVIILPLILFRINTSTGAAKIAVVGEAESSYDGVYNGTNGSVDPYVGNNGSVNSGANSGLNSGASNNPFINEIVIDASAIPKGSAVNVIAPNIIINESENGYSSSGGRNMDMHDLFIDRDTLERFNGEKIIVSYSLPQIEFNFYNTARLANPKLTAYLDGSTLYVDYSYDKNVKAVFIPVWSFMWQFDGFKGKGIFQEQGGFQTGGGPGIVVIRAE